MFCAPEKEGARPDALRAAAQEKGLKVHQFKSLRDPEAAKAMQDAGADIGIMAFVLQFAPQEFVKIPKHGTIQYHPSLLPKYRGPSSINWPIIKGDTETGLTIFRPSDGLDEGAVILQKKTPISPDDTLGTVYFDRLFPMGVQAMLEAADLVLAGKHTETVQDESRASYEGWCRSGEAKIDWAKPIDHVYNLIRGCNPAPGAWTTFNGKKLQIFDARKTLFRRFADVPGRSARSPTSPTKASRSRPRAARSRCVQGEVRGRQKGDRRRARAVGRDCGGQPARRMRVRFTSGE